MKTKQFIANTLAFTLFGLFLMQPAMSQSTDYSEMEEIQDEIENLYIKTYTIFEKHPYISYEYIHSGDQIDAVTIQGLSDEKAKKRLEVYLLDIAELENEILNRSNRTGVFYVTETEPRPKDGLDEFNQDLRSKIDYPKINGAPENLEGTLFAKFVVNDEGEIGDVIFTSNFEDKDNIQVKMMKNQTEKAIQSTSGDWVPAKVGGIPVAEWVVLPVQFTVKEDYYDMMW
ncbi:MAG: hypothetical protein RLO17_25140 [Cyclobacteriaceae bacterium]